MSTNDHSEDVRQRRESLLLTQQQVAALAGVSDETYRKVEHGLKVSPRTLKSVLDAIAAEEAKANAAAITLPVAGIGPETGRLVYEVEGRDGIAASAAPPDHVELTALIARMAELVEKAERIFAEPHPPADESHPDDSTVGGQG